MQDLVFEGHPEQKLRPATVYFNARQYGLSKEDARQCSDTWARIFDTCFLQRVAGNFYNESNVTNINFPAEHQKGTLYVTAHFSAYTFVSIALARHYKKDIYIVVGTPSAQFESFLVDSLADAGVKAIIIRSNFSQLRNIRRAIDEGHLVLSLIDVPWHRTVIPNREHEYFDLGVGKIRASKSIFKIAERLNLVPTLVLCEPNGSDFNINYYGQLSQSECFEKLAKVVALNPGHFERFCELHVYYKGGVQTKEVVTFVLGEHRYMAVPSENKYWKLGQTCSKEIESKLQLNDNNHEASKIIINQIEKVSKRVYDEVVYF